MKVTGTVCTNKDGLRIRILKLLIYQVLTYLLRVQDKVSI